MKISKQFKCDVKGHTLYNSQGTFSLSQPLDLQCVNGNF
jgi:hypothetical protein